MRGEFGQSLNLLKTTQTFLPVKVRKQMYKLAMKAQALA